MCLLQYDFYCSTIIFLDLMEIIKCHIMMNDTAVHLQISEKQMIIKFYFKHEKS